MRLSGARFHFKNVQNSADEVFSKRDNQYQIGWLTHWVILQLKKYIYIVIYFKQIKFKTMLLEDDLLFSVANV